MTVRQILGTALFCGAIGTLGGQSAHAQAPKSTKFVQLLLTKEKKAIAADTKALNTRDQDIAKLNGTTNRRQIAQLNKSLNKLHGPILKMTTSLISLSVQTYNNANATGGRTSPLTLQALAYLKTVQLLSLRDGLGIMPATPTQ